MVTAYMYVRCKSLDIWSLYFFSLFLKRFRVNHEMRTLWSLAFRSRRLYWPVHQVYVSMNTLKFIWLRGHFFKYDIFSISLLITFIWYHIASLKILNLKHLKSEKKLSTRNKKKMYFLQTMIIILYMKNIGDIFTKYLKKSLSTIGNVFLSNVKEKVRYI